MSVYESLGIELCFREYQSLFPEGLEPGEDGLVAVGGYLSPQVIVEAYSKSYFPWTGEPPIPWFSPDPRMVLFPKDFVVSRSLKKLLRKDFYTIRFDYDFPSVIRACAAPRVYEPSTWIKPNMITTYTELSELNLAHCVGVYQEDRLVGGLYGVSLGRAFFGESMFSWVPNGSKVALYALCQFLKAHEFDFVDCQQETPHLRSLGAVPIPRTEYLERLAATLKRPVLQYSWG